MARKQPDEADDKTTQVGLYQYARAYHESARALRRAKVKTMHGGAPVAFLYFHAIELFLKAYLRLKGLTIHELRDEFGHGFAKLRARAAAFNFDFMDEDLEVLSYMEHPGLVMRSRYIRTGAFVAPTIEALERTAASLRETTCAAIRRTGIRVRR